MAYSHEHRQHVADHVAERVPEVTGRASSVPDIVEAVEAARPVERAQVPVGEGDVEARRSVGKITIATVKSSAGSRNRR